MESSAVSWSSVVNTRGQEISSHIDWSLKSQKIKQLWSNHFIHTQSALPLRGWVDGILHYQKMGSEEAAAKSTTMDLESKRLQKGYQMTNELNLLDCPTVIMKLCSCLIWAEEMKTGESNLSCCHTLRGRLSLRLLWRQKLNSCLKESLFIHILCVYRLIRNPETDHSCILRFQFRLITLKKQRGRKTECSVASVPGYCIQSSLLHLLQYRSFINIKDYSIRDQLFL